MSKFAPGDIITLKEYGEPITALGHSIMNGIRKNGYRDFVFLETVGYEQYGDSALEFIKIKKLKSGVIIEEAYSCDFILNKKLTREYKLKNILKPNV